LRNVVETAGGQRSAKSAVWYYAGHIRPLACPVKQIIYFVPLLLTFIVFKMEPRSVEVAEVTLEVAGIFSETAALIASSVVIYTALSIHQRRLYGLTSRPPAAYA
jgi:intracellular septation protein